MARCGGKVEKTFKPRPWPESGSIPPLPSVPTHLAHIMFYICMGCWWSMCVPKPCVCRGAISFYHVLFDCRECSAHFTTVTNSVTSLGLSLCIWSPVLQHLNLFIAVLPDGKLLLLLNIDRLQLNTHTPYVCGFEWSVKVHGCMVYTERAETAADSCGTSHASAVSTPLRWIFKNAH